jgi:hypothetical protein
MLLNPMTAGPGSDVTPTRMADELRGAYLAQVASNAVGTLGIQLLLDDEGTSAEAAEGPAVSACQPLGSRLAHDASEPGSMPTRVRPDRSGLPSGCAYDGRRGVPSPDPVMAH